jgi:hypothetical protein
MNCGMRIDAAVDKIMLDAIYIGLVCGAFMSFLLYVIGCQKL